MFEKFLNILKNTGELLSRPLFGSFFVYLTLIWLLNIADILQTLMLKRGGHLKREANIFINYFLVEDEVLFIVAKCAALLLITCMLLRGYYDKKGTTVGGVYYSPGDMRKAITFLLGAGVTYYLVIVLMPFIVLIIGHLLRGNQA
jgi:hypothetical protein